MARETGAKIVLSSDWRASEILFKSSVWPGGESSVELCWPSKESVATNSWEWRCLPLGRPKIVSDFRKEELCSFDSCHLAACILRMLLRNCLGTETSSRFLHMTGGIMDHELADVFPIEHEGFTVSYVQSAEGSRFKIKNFCICWALPTSCTTTESEKHSWRERGKWEDVVGRTTWRWWRVVDSEVQIDNTCPPWPEVRFWQTSWPQYLNLYKHRLLFAMHAHGSVTTRAHATTPLKVQSRQFLPNSIFARFLKCLVTNHQLVWNNPPNLKTQKICNFSQYFCYVVVLPLAHHQTRGSCCVLFHKWLAALCRYPRSPGRVRSLIESTVNIGLIGQFPGMGMGKVS